MSQNELNLGILAHVDAGKTTLTERLLYEAGVIDVVGYVDAGTTQTDSLELERRRGITIKSAVASFALEDVHVNLVDTPGHPDFIAEVERVLSVLDGAVLVISAVEGVQPQTRILMRALQRLHIPTLLFVNKIDRPGASDERVLQAISERLTTAIVPMGTPRGLGTRTASFRLAGAGDAEHRARLAELLAERDDGILAAYVDDESVVPYQRLRRELAAQTKRALVHPVFFGSAITGAGVELLAAGIAELLPSAAGDPDGPAGGAVFKIERGTSGEKVAYVRMFSGTIRTRDRVHFGAGAEGKVTAIAVFDRGPAVRRQAVSAGAVAKLWGLAEVQIGDRIGEAGAEAAHQFPPPTLETVVVPRIAGDKGRLRVALAQLAEQDPLIDVRQDDGRQELSLSLYGEVQKEVVQATLASDFGLDVTFRETTPLYVERPIATGEAIEILRAESNPFLATIGLRIDPAPSGSGIDFRLQVDNRTTPLFIYKNAENFTAEHGRVRPRGAAGGAPRLAGPRLHGDDDRLHVQRPRRPSVETRAAQHGGGLPKADADRRHASPRRRGDGRLRAGRPSEPRDPGGRDRRCHARVGAVRRGCRVAGAAGEALHDRAGHGRGAGARPPAAAAGADGW